jgi:hypothetical protein|tara:strand:+ start:877 stop:1077 length:201 start_codon:yes stop_codon:yes gene_type:complete
MGIKDALKDLENSIKEIPLLPEKSDKLRKVRKEIEEKFKKNIKKGKITKGKHGGLAKRGYGIARRG